MLRTRDEKGASQRDGDNRNLDTIVSNCLLWFIYGIGDAETVNNASRNRALNGCGNARGSTYKLYDLVYSRTPQCSATDPRDSLQPESDEISSQPHDRLFRGELEASGRLLTLVYFQAGTHDKVRVTELIPRIVLIAKCFRHEVRHEITIWMPKSTTVDAGSARDGARATMDTAWFGVTPQVHVAVLGVGDTSVKTRVLENCTVLAPKPATPIVHILLFPCEFKRSKGHSPWQQLSFDLGAAQGQRKALAMPKDIICGLACSAEIVEVQWSEWREQTPEVSVSPGSETS